jgi:leucyl-tRNA synthetase
VALGHTTRDRATPEVTHAAGLAPADVLLIGVADLADRRAALDVHATDFARREHERRVLAFLVGQLAVHARAAADLAALAGLELDAVQKALEGRPVRKIIIVPQRIVNVVA